MMGDLEPLLDLEKLETTTKDLPRPGDGSFSQTELTVERINNTMPKLDRYDTSLLDDIYPDAPHNGINDVGFPEAQLLGNGATDEQCAEISAAFRTGEPMPTTGNEALDRLVGYLQQHSAYGKEGQR